MELEVKIILLDGSEIKVRSQNSFDVTRLLLSFCPPDRDISDFQLYLGGRILKVLVFLFYILYSKFFYVPEIV